MEEPVDKKNMCFNKALLTRKGVLYPALFLALGGIGGCQMYSLHLLEKAHQKNIELVRNVDTLRLDVDALQKSMNAQIANGIKGQRLMLSKMNESNQNVLELTRAFYLPRNSIPLENPSIVTIDSGRQPKDLLAAITPFNGIGIKYSHRGDRLHIEEVFSGSPAAKAGLYVGDMILKIVGQPVSELGEIQIPQRIRGAQGTSVVLSYAPAGSVGVTKDVSVKREPIDLNNQKQP